MSNPTPEAGVHKITQWSSKLDTNVPPSTSARVARTVTPHAGVVSDLPSIRNDDLGKLIYEAIGEFERAESWEAFVEKGRQKADLSQRVGQLNHPANHLLKHLRDRGAPVTVANEPWSMQRKEEAIRRGPHKSAKEYAEFVREEFVDFVHKGFWRVLPYRLVKHIRNLRLSPLGVVPQRNRRPRLIVDLSFYLVNQDCVPLSPAEAMQFGRALQRLLQRILDADPIFGPVRMAKIDIADGFYRIKVAANDVPKLGVLLPQDATEEPMVGFPYTLPMGWVNSPPYFSAATETGADLMNQKLSQMDKGGPELPRHRLEDLALQATHIEEEQHATVVRRTLPSATAAPLRRTHAPRYRRPLAYADVYVDDFIALMQGDDHRQRQTMRVLLHTLDEIFRPLETDDGPHRQEPASTKKLQKGDAVWTTSKVVLGWLIDTVAGTISLPPHRYERLIDILGTIRPEMKRAGVKVWHRLLGELRSMMMAIPGARGLFSTLQHALKTDERGKPHRVRLTTAVHQFLEDFRMLAQDLSQRPTRISELLARLPSVIGTTDAAGPGMGGVAFLHTPTNTTPVAWRAPFPAHVQRRLVSWNNPNGDITNSDLELAATVVHHDVIAQAADVREHTIQSLHDNTPAQYWQRKGSTTTSGPAAYLLRLQSFHQRHYRYVARHDFLSGDLNRMGDDASRLWHMTTALAAAPGPRRNAFFRDLRISQETVQRGVVLGTRQKANRHWEQWLQFCTDLEIDPLLQSHADPVPFLQVFATRYRQRLGPAGLPVRSGTVSDAVRSVGQTMASMGTADARHNQAGKLDFRLTRQFRAYTREDPPPHRVKPIPVSLLRLVANQSVAGTPAVQAIADMIILAFFFLLRPGEYTGSNNDDTPFRLQDAQLWIGTRRIDLFAATNAELAAATSISLTFTTQKNGVRGEVVNHGCSGHPFLCPVQVVVRRLRHLRGHQAAPDTILASFYEAGQHKLVLPRDVTATLKAAAQLLGAQYGYSPNDVSARSLRAGGAMALFNSDVDSDTIRLLGRWQSDAMLRYLHLQAQPAMRGFARRMLDGGDYAFHPNQNIPNLDLVPLY